MEKKKGLGKGLEAMFGEAALLTNDTGSQLLPMSRVEPNQDQPRKYFEPEALETLAESIRQYGVLQPLTVRRLDNGQYQIITGERRWRAARMADLKEIPATIIEADDRKALELGLIENLQREDLNPLEEAQGYKNLIEEFGLSQEEAAQRVGISRPAVANALRLLNLPEEIQQMLAEKSLSGGHARALLGLKDKEAMLKAAEQIIKQQLSVRQTEALVKKLQEPKAEEEEKPKQEIDYVKLAADDLTKKLGRKVSISQGKKRGKIELEFYGSDDLQLLIEQIEKLIKQD